MTNPRHFTPKDVFDKARDVANDHPDIVRGGLDRVADESDRRTGGRFKDAVDKGQDVIEDQLGLPDDNPSAPEPVPDQPAPGQPVPQEPAPQPAPDRPAPETVPDTPIEVPGSDEPLRIPTDPA